ncbi:hypothetical protein TWF225_010995 [Orbilia oligospora]|uniref:Uncharacterized protein n=1 Tax=Orbilia oligospora TaxID=2813651 RepID=A0A7C8P9Z4_ORBOL|nr:hypothetical protein TWF751_009805 [Orbilia oligospora]KAF3193154.1 hypothetical protein TWF225_010995 [Orbilia oligospora]KAF3265687.1 hypothetical protein TWF217_002231 [Orbilia oligospora]KAF3271617.1 hypothetical protein TWF128_000186 [Orbilia oligospora]KAF3295107.1 hypothetical protein TWF132_002426 [Orbilia oligospora]
MLSQTLITLSLLSLAAAQAPAWGQCGGIGWTGPTNCASGSSCVKSNDYYSQCIPGSSGGGTTTTAQATATTTGGTSVKTGWEEVIGEGSFNSFSSFWNYLYPWGPDHNGSARMKQDKVSVSGGVLTLRADRLSSQDGYSTANPKPAIWYWSGAVHAKSTVVVNDQFPNWEIRGEFKAPTTKGTWPAFWLTGTQSWPPEIDILEFKGNTENWFNTFRSSSDVSTTKANVGNAASTWHQYRIWATKANSKDVTVHFYVDGDWKGQHNAAGFVGKPMWIIINLQMEGSSGSPGPSGSTTYQAQKIYVGRTRAS